MESQAPPKTQCARHGLSDSGLMCRHLLLESGKDYYACADVEGEAPQAWCALCDEVLCAEQGWTDRACGVADWKIVCVECYHSVLSRHHLVAISVGTDEPQ